MATKKIIELTQEGLDKLKTELRYLVDVKRDENLEALKEARSQGDLSENADFDAARHEQAVIEARISELEYTIKNAKIVKPTQDNIVEIGKTVNLLFVEKKQEKVYTIVGTIESNPIENRISVDSPLARAIKGSTIGDTVTVQTEVGKIYHVKVLEFINNNNESV